MGNSENAIELRGITKRFGDTVANNAIDLDVRKGEILSLLGENGSGKTTLMNMLSGIYFPDEGEILVGGKPVVIRSPRDAYDLGIGMVHQHFKLIDVLTAWENVVLGLKEEGRFSARRVREKIRTITERYGFRIDPDKKIYDMSVSEKQTVEIIKVLYRGANILILDEPTAVLTPQETEQLFDVLRNMRRDGKAIIIITHKLAEVMEISDRVAVLRKGEHIGTVETKDTNPRILTNMMVGQEIELHIDRPEPKDPKEVLVLSHVSCTDRSGVKKLDDVSFTVRSGEILGVAGISGCGQKELLEGIAGLQKISGSVLYTKEDGTKQQLVGMSSMQIQDLGIRLSFVPEDRLGMGLVGNMNMIGNMMLRSFKLGRFGISDRKTPTELAEHVKEELDVMTPDIHLPVRRMSGGNIQKVLVGREIAANPRVLMTAYAVRGLDINTSYAIYHLLNEQKQKGVAVIYVGEELDVLLQLCDRILVLCGGRVSGIVDGRTATKEQVGMLMTRVGGETE